MTIAVSEDGTDLHGLGGDLDGGLPRGLASPRGVDTTPFVAGDGLFTDWDTGQVVDRGEPNAAGIDAMLDSDGTARQLEQVLTLPIRSAPHALVGGSEKGRKLVEENLPEAARARFIAEQTSGIVFRKAFFELDWRVDGRRVRLGRPPAFRPAIACEQLFNRQTGAPDGFRKRVHDPGGVFNANEWRRWYGPPMPGWIPVTRQRSHIFVNGAHRQPLKGTTDLSVCWWAYETRKKLLFLWMRYIERATDPKFVVYGDSVAEARRNARSMAALRGGGFAPAKRPSDPQARAFEVLEAATAAAPLFEAAARYLNGHMVDSCLAGFTQLSSGAASAGHGSRALAESDSEFFLKSRQAVADEQGLQATIDIATPLCIYNGLDLADVPQIKIGPLSKDKVGAALDMVKPLLTANTVNAPDEFLDGLLQVIAPTLNLDGDKLADAIKSYREEQAEQRQQMQDAMNTPDEPDAEQQGMPGGQPGPSGLAQRQGAPDDQGADLANEIDAAYALVEATQRTGDPDGALNALMGRPDTARRHIDLATPKAEPKHTGGMVALLPDDDTADHLLVTGQHAEPREELHLTVVYLGDDVTGWTPARRDTVLGDARALAARTAPIDGTAMGHSVFNPNGDGGHDPATVYLISTTGADPLRKGLDRHNASEFPTFLPHVTAGYGLAPSRLSYTGPVRFDRLLVALGDEQHIIPLTGGSRG